MKRIACLLLALLMLSASLVACDNDNPAQTSGDVTGDAVITTGAEMPDIPMTADYDEYEFNILSAGNMTWNEFDFEEESSIPLDNAQYKRKQKVEEDYNITIVPTIETAYSSGGGPGAKAVTKQVSSGDCDYDLCIIAGYDVSVLAYSGKLYDMASIEDIDLSKSWWDGNVTNSLSVKDVVFFTTGELTTTDNLAAFCILFNKQLHEDYQLENVYDMVKDGVWTIENFGKLVKSVSQDLNEDGLYTEDDRYGLLVWDDSIVGIVNAADQRCCTINDEGVIELTFYNETTLSALEQYADVAYDRQYAFHYQRVSEETGYNMWVKNQALFWTTIINAIPGLREMETDFGILPFPKLTVEQDSYYSTIAPYSSNFVCVPIIQDDVNRTGVIAEALAYYGQQIVTPALYDVTLIGQGTRDEESEPMLDLIFATQMYDIGYYYQVGPYNKQLIVKLRARDTNFTSMYDTYKSSAQSLLNVINKFYAIAVEEWLTPVGTETTAAQ